MERTPVLSLKLRRPLRWGCLQIHSMTSSDRAGAPFILRPLPGMDSFAVLPPPFLLCLTNRYRALNNVGAVLNPLSLLFHSLHITVL